MGGDGKLSSYESRSKTGLEKFGWRWVILKLKAGTMSSHSSRISLLSRVDTGDMEAVVTGEPGGSGEFNSGANSSSSRVSDSHGCTRTLKGYGVLVEERFWDEASRLRKWINSTRPRSLVDWWQLLLINALACFVTAASGIFTFESSDDSLRGSEMVSIVFPLYLPHAVATTVACKFDRPVYLGNLLGLYATRLYSGWRGDYLSSSRAVVLLAASAVGSAEASTSAFFLRRLLCRDNFRKVPTIESITGAVLFLITVFTSTFFYDTIIALVICTSNLVKWSNFLKYWASSWMGVLAAMLTVAPCLLHFLVWVPRQSLLRPRKIAEVVFIACVTSGLVVIMFLTNVQAVIRPLPYLLFPVIILSAFRLNRLGCSLLVMLTSYACVWASIRGKGAVYKMAGSPKPYSSPKLILQVELFICVLGLVGILLAAAVREKKRLARDLANVNEVLESTVNQRTQALVKANEELTVSQRKAEEASQAKSDFLANMSHEIRTPIHGIMGLTALLLDSEMTVDQRDSLSSVKECADLLLHIINSILDLAKIEAGRVEVEYVPFNVRKLVSNTVRMLMTRAQDRQVDLRCEVDSTVPEWVVGDSGKIQQCLLNLVGNAVKFTHEGSVTVHVSAASARRSMVWRPEDREHLLPTMINGGDGGGRRDSVTMNVFETPVEWGSDESSEGKDLDYTGSTRKIVGFPVTFEVRDTGIGINNSKLQDIFTPFTQADTSTSRVYGGTGLGLCIVQRFVELLGGKLRAESELGKGSTFRFSVLLRPTEDPDAKADGRVEGSLYGRKRTTTEARKIKTDVIANGVVPVVSPSPIDSQNTIAKNATFAEVPASGVNQNPVHTDDSEQEKPSEEEYNDALDAGVTARRSNSEVSISAYLEALEGQQGKAGSQKGDASTRRRSRQSWENVLRLWSSEINRKSGRTSIEEPFPPRDCSSVNVSSRDSDHLPHEVSRQNSMPSQRPDILSAQAERRPFFSKESSLECNIAVQSDDRNDRLEDLHSQNSSIGQEEARNERSDQERKNNSIAPEQSTRHDIDRRPHPPTQTRQEPNSGGEATVEENRLRVLLAEDNLINQKIAIRQLQKHGHNVTVVGDGSAALESVIASHDSFDLVLMDVQMPIMDGLEATRRIREEEAQRGWSRLIVLGLTAHAIQGYDNICLSNGMDGYLGKPFDINQLLRVMDKHTTAR